MDILRANIPDAPEILHLQKLAYQSEAELYNDYTIPPLTQTLEQLENKFKDHIFLKAVEKEEIIGSIRANVLNKNRIYLGRLIVHPDHQNQGIGSRLISEIETYFPDINRFELITGHKSLKNINFYQKRGYKPYKKENYSEDIILLYMFKLVDLE